MMAAGNKSNIILLGGTGTIGKYILRELVNAKASFGRLGVVTRESTAKEKAKEVQRLKEQGVEVIIAELTDEVALSKAFEGYDTVISALGRGALQYQIPIIRLANKTAHIKRFIPSEFGTDIEHNSKSAHEKTHQGKLAVRKFIREEVDDLSGFYLVTGPYPEMWLDKGVSGKAWKAGGWDVKERKAIIPGNPDGKISFTTMPDVGRLLVAALLHAPETGNGYRAFVVNSFTTTPSEVLGEFERQTGAKWTSEATPVKELRTLENELWQEGNPIAARATLRSIWAEGGTQYEKTDTEELGFKNPQTLQWAVAEAIKAQNEGKASSA